VPQAIAPAAAAVAALWYLQAIVPDDLLVAIPVQQAVSLVIPLLALAWWQRVDLRRTLRLTLPAKGRSLATAFAGAALVGIGLFVVGAAAVLVLVGENASVEMKALATRLIRLVMERPVWLSWVLIAVVPAVCEEVVFRGWVLSGLAGERPDGIRRAAAVAAQAAFFAAVHLLPERMPTTFVLGLVLGWMALATGSLLPGIVCHAAHNSVPIAIVLIAGGTASPDSDAAAWPLWLPALGAVAAIVGGFVVARETRKRSARKRSD
jgi:membrane protease YdiL (CAAX protease family)